jgi:hypothetical protein
MAKAVQKVQMNLRFRDLKVEGVSACEFSIGDVLQLSIVVPLSVRGAQLRWFSDNDQVLEILVDESTHNARVTAHSEGVSLIAITKPRSKKPLMTIPVTVVDLGPLHTALNLRAEHVEHVEPSNS